MKNKNILIGITGSIAAYKICDIIRILRKEGANVQAIMTKSAQEFIGKTTIAALTNNKVWSSSVRFGATANELEPNGALSLQIVLGN